MNNGNAPDAIEDYVLPHEHRPGTDTINKIVLTDERVIDLVATNLVDAPPKAYAACATEFINGSKSDVLYVPRSDIAGPLPPIAIQIHKIVDDAFMARAISNCSSVSQVHHQIPILLIVGVSNITRSVLSRATACSGLPFAKEVACDFWARRCLLVSWETLTMEPLTTELDLLAALGVFLCSQAYSMQQLEYGRHDIAMKVLYTVAREHVERLSAAEDEKLQGIRNICENAENQLQKIKDCIKERQSGSVDKALLYIDDATHYLQRQKRKYTTTIETTPIPETPPSQKPKSSPKGRVRRSDEHLDILVAYVERFRDPKTKRICWKECFQQGIDNRFEHILRYKTAESVRTRCNKYRKLINATP